MRWRGENLLSEKSPQFLNQKLRSGTFTLHEREQRTASPAGNVTESLC
jgi:hypothetical protein